MFRDADDTESDGGKQSSSSDEPNEIYLPTEIRHAIIVPQTEDSDSDFLNRSMSLQYAPSTRSTDNLLPMQFIINLNALEVWNSKDQNKPSKRLGRHFQGACLDTGA